MILATAGHIDHGKTALVRALTGVDADRLPEEKRRGLTIDLGFAYATLPDGTELGFVDVPGHERFLPNMLAGVLSIDRVLLVVAADDGPRPQTLEHLDILELIGVAEVTGVVTKIDRVEPDRTAAVVEEVGALLAAAGFAESPIFPVSSRSGDGIADLTDHLQESARIAERNRAAAPASGLFRMPIDRAFTLPGIGLVVTGTVAAGTVTVGERLIDQPARYRRARARAAFAKPPGRRVPPPASVAPSISPARFRRGASPAAAIGSWRPSGTRRRGGSISWCGCRASPRRRCATGCRSISISARPTSSAASPCSAGARSRPGESGFVQVDFEQPIGALHGDRAVLRDHAARHTLGRRTGRRPVPAAARPPAAGAARRSRSDRRSRSGAGALRRLLEVEGLVALPDFALARNLAPAELDCADRRRRISARRDRARTGCGYRRTVGRLVRQYRCSARGIARGTARRARPDPAGPARSAARRGAGGGARGGARRARQQPAGSCAKAQCGGCPNISRG